MSAPPLRPLVWTTARPCVRCGLSDRCSVSTNGAHGLCRTVRAWHPTDRVKEDRNGEEYAVISLGASGSDQSPGQQPDAPEAPISEWRMLIAAPDVRHRIYSTLASECPLQKDDLAGLLARGLSIEECRALGYWSHPADPDRRSHLVFQMESEKAAGESGKKRGLREKRPEFSQDELVGTPGIYRIDGTGGLVLSGPGGLGIPVRDTEGRIVGARVRHVGEDRKKRVLWLSSPARPDVLSAGCSALAHVPLMSVELRASVMDARSRGTLTVRITEGEIKADIATLRTGILTLSIPGANQWRPVLSVIEHLRPVRVLLAFDGDARTNPAVAGGLQRLAAALVKQDITLAVETWPAEFKGIDDALTALANVTVHEGADAVACIASLVSSSGAKSDPQAAATLDAAPEVTAARTLVAALPARAKAAGAARVALSPETLSAALVLHKHDPAEYAQLKITLKTLKVPAADWKAAMERAQAATQAQSRTVRHMPGVASAAPGAEPPPPPSDSADDPSEPDGPPPPFERGDADELARTLLDDMRRSAASPIGVIYDRGAYWTYMPHGLWAPAATDPHNIVSGYAGREVQDDRGKGTKPLKLANGAIEGAVKNASRLAAQPGFFNEATPGIMFRNGILVVRKTGEVCNGREVQRIVLESPTPGHRAIHRIDCDYDPEAPAPKWSPALRAMFTPPMPNEDIPNAETEPEAFAEFERARAQDAEDCAQLLHAFLGISLLGKATDYAKCLVLFGDGSNGKSTVIDVLSALAPRSSICALPPHQWANHFHLAGLLHKRLNMVNELPAKDLMEAETFKAVIAGNSTTVSFKHRDPFDFNPRAGHVFAANRLPGTSDQTEGFWRRFMVLCFDRKFQGKEIIYDLAAQIIAEELDGVAARCIAAAQKVLDDGGFTLPASSTRMMDEWRERSDQVRQFIGARCRELDSASHPNAASLDTLYAAYTPWAQRNGFTRMNSANFGERLRTLGFFKRTKLARLYRLALLVEEDSGVGAPGLGDDTNSTSSGASGSAVGWTPPRKRFLS